MACQIIAFEELRSEGVLKEGVYMDGKWVSDSDVCSR